MRATTTNDDLFDLQVEINDKLDKMIADLQEARDNIKELNKTVEKLNFKEIWEK